MTGASSAVCPCPVAHLLLPVGAWSCPNLNKSPWFQILTSLCHGSGQTETWSCADPRHTGDLLHLDPARCCYSRVTPDQGEIPASHSRDSNRSAVEQQEAVSVIVGERTQTAGLAQRKTRSLDFSTILQVC